MIRYTLSKTTKTRWRVWGRLNTIINFYAWLRVIRINRQKRQPILAVAKEIDVLKISVLFIVVSK